MSNIPREVYHGAKSDISDTKRDNDGNNRHD